MSLSLTLTAGAVVVLLPLADAANKRVKFDSIVYETNYPSEFSLKGAALEFSVPLIEHKLP